MIISLRSSVYIEEIQKQRKKKNIHSHIERLREREREREREKMAEVVLGTIVGELFKYLFKPLKDQVSYLCCYSCNVPKLADEVGKLNNTYESVQQNVDAKRNNLEEITPMVNSWLEEVKMVKRESDRIQNAAEEIGKSCLCKWIPVVHYCLSRDAVKKTEDANKLLNKAPSVSISNPQMPAEMEPVPHPSEHEFKSRDETEQDIMEALKDPSVYLIGLHGMGGIGKTTMARKIEQRVKHEKLFKHVVFQTVSQPLDVSGIQKDIAKELGLQLSGEPQDSQAKILHTRLRDEDSVLIILDDVWQILKLEDIGIPSQTTHAGCKLILTSRDEQNFNIIGNPKSEIIKLHLLGKEESWILFRDNVGDAIESPDLIEIAKDIVEECQGLPLALEVLGCALRVKDKSDRLDKSYLENALKELKQSMPTNIKDVEQKVYRTLMYSIERLESPDARRIFLLCCLFPEDHHISLEELVRCGIGLRVFEAEELIEARNKVESILHNLISRALLRKSPYNWGTLHVQMHDLNRDVGIWIASKKKIESEGGITSKEKHIFMVSHGNEKWPMIDEESYGDYTCISLRFSKGGVDIPEFLDCPRLELLHIGLMETWSRSYLDIPVKFFGGMGNLRVLEASNLSSFPVLEASIGLLKRLRTLYLDHCMMIGMASAIGELTNLEILCLERCMVDVLPEEIGGLKKLRQMDISHCRELRVAFGVISGLVQLEELVISNSFKTWEAQAHRSTNASVAELDRLNHLTTLRIQIQNPSVVPTSKPDWVQNLKRYCLLIQDVQKNISPRSISQLHGRFRKAISWECKDTPFPEWLYGMASDAEYLKLVGPSCSAVAKRLDPYSRNPNCLKDLSLSKFTDVQYLVGSQKNGAVFPMLKSLCIKDSCSLLEISNVPPPAGSFAALEKIKLKGLSGLTNLWEFSTEKLYLSNLESVKIRDCINLEYLFSFSVAQSLSRLKVLEVSNCPMIEEIFKKENGEMETNQIEFPKLDSLYLESMERICHLCKRIDRIEVSALRWLQLKNLPNIFGMAQRCLFEQQFAGNFTGLQYLIVERIHKLKCLFSPSILHGFSNLEGLSVKDCPELEEIIGKDENVGEKTSFPKLKTLELLNLPKIHTFSYTGVKMTLLKLLHIKSCPMMDGFFHGLFDAPNSRFGTPFFNKELAGNFSELQILTVESSHKIKCLFSPSILSGFSNLEELTVEDCLEFKEVIGKDENVGEIISFPRLKKLELFNLPKIVTFCYMGIKLPSLERLHVKSCSMLEQFFQGLSDTPNSRFDLPFFNKEFAGNISELQILRVESIHKLKCLFSPSILLSGFSNLEELTVKDCSKFEEVIGKDENVGKTIVFPKLKKLELFDLSKIFTFCYTSIELPSLENLCIQNCPLMERFAQRLSDTSNSRFSLPFFNEEVYCPKLEYLKLKQLPRIARIFSPPAFRAQTNLKELSLWGCNELQEVIGKEEEGEGLINNIEILSPQLKKFNLRKMPKIHIFCHMKYGLKFPSLESVTFDNCPMLERFSLGPLHLPNIRCIDGLPNADFASKFFFNKEISSSESPLEEENNCFSVSASKISMSFGNSERPILRCFLAPSSSESFVESVEILSYRLVEIKGNFETTKLVEGVAYEIMLIIMLAEFENYWEEPVGIELTLSGGITQQCRTSLRQLPREKWIEISLGKITREPHQSGQLEFVLRQPNREFKRRQLCIKGVRMKA